MMNFLKMLVLVAVIGLIAWSAPSEAAKVTLKSGETLEGEIVREGEGFIYLRMAIGGVSHDRLILMVDVSQIDREEPAAPATPAAPANGAPAKQDEPSKQSIADGATRVAFISLEDTVGSHLNAGALEESFKRLDDDDVDVIVLRINSGGGALAEVEPLSDFIERKMKPKARVVAWIESAISAASLTAHNLEEVYFMKEGNYGGTVAYTMTGPGQAKAASGENLEQILRLGEKISRRGNHDPLVMRAMQVYTNLSCDIDEETGKVTWRNDLEGEHIVSTENMILTLNSRDALKYGLSRATCDTKDELMTAMGITEWVEVGKDADAYQREFRENVSRAQVKIQELGQKMEIAISVGQIPRARGFLGEIRTWVRRAPSLEMYMGLNDEWFREQEERLRKAASDQARRG